jgi:hypothetical protein
MSILGIKARNGPWILTEHSVRGDNGYMGTIGQSEWADWSREGDLLFAQSGCLYRLRATKGRLGAIEQSEVIADFNGLAFRRLEPPNEARLWPAHKGKRRKKVARR